MIDPEIQKYVSDQIKKAQNSALYTTKNAASHTHNGIDSPKLDLSATTAGVASIIAGTNVTISPVGGTGNVTVNAATASGVSSITASGSGISASPTAGAVLIANTGVTSIVAGSNVTISGSTGAVTINSSISGSSIATLSGTDSLSATTPINTTHTITHGFGKRPTTITLSFPPIVAAAPSGSGFNAEEPQGFFTIDTNGNPINGLYVSYHFVAGGSGTFTLTGGGIATNSITASASSGGGTGTMTITLNNVTATTFDIVYLSSGVSGQTFTSPTLTWTVLG